MINGVDKDALLREAIGWEREEDYHSKRTESKLVKEWQDAPEPGRSVDDWPYPNKYRKCEIKGELARIIRRHLKIPYTVISHEVPAVYITEVEISGGYSEYTQEIGRYILLECGGKTFKFGDDYTVYPFMDMMKWLETETVSED